jgi:hypothetical protein
MPIVDDDDDDVEEEEYEESFIDDSDDLGGPRPSVVPTARFEDIVAWMELQVRRSEPPEHLAEYLKGAEAAYRKLAQDMQLLASQAEAGWCKGFARLVKRVHSARISVDPTKSRTRKKGVCAACGVKEYLSPKRLDLVGNFPMATFCRQAWSWDSGEDDPEEAFLNFDHMYLEEREAGSKEDHGLFYLGTTCLRKFETSFMLRTLVSNLFMEIAHIYDEAEKKRRCKAKMPTTQFATGAFGAHGFEFHPATKDLFDAYPERRQLLELATGCQRVEPPVLAVDAVLFAAVDAKRNGVGADALYRRGLEAIQQRSGEDGDEDERGAPEAAEDAYATRARERGRRQSEAGPSWDNGKAPEKLPPKKRVRRVAPSDDGDETEEEAPASSPILEVAAAAPAAPPAARSKAWMPSGASLAALSRADGELPSEVKAIAGLHQLAGQLLTQGQQREAGIVAAGAFTAQTLLEKLEHARAR